MRADEYEMAKGIFPDWKSPCEIGTEIPDFVAQFLQLDALLHRRFREESISDVIVASLVNLHSDQVFALIPDERKTGSDFDIIILDQISRNSVQFRIQAKRIHPNLREWELGTYRHLAHPNNTGKQAQTLIQSSAHEMLPTIPLYAFYNPSRVCEDSGGAVRGLELASGRDVSILIKALVKAQPRRIPLKRIKYIKRLFFPFSTILCPPTNGMDQRLIPTPDAARKAVEGLIDSRATSFNGIEVESGLGLAPMSLGSLTVTGVPEAVPRRLEPPSTESVGILQLPREEMKPRIPKVVEKALANRGDQKILRAKVARPRVILLSDEQ